MSFDLGDVTYDVMPAVQLSATIHKKVLCEMLSVAFSHSLPDPHLLPQSQSLLDVPCSPQKTQSGNVSLECELR